MLPQTQSSPPQPSNLLSWLPKPKLPNPTQSTNPNSTQSPQPLEPMPQKLIILQNGQALFHESSTLMLLNSHRINSRMIGVSSSSKNAVDFVNPPYLIDKYACAYLIKNKVVGYDQEWSNQIGIGVVKGLGRDWTYAIFQCLTRDRGMILADGHKFGCLFLAYDQQPINSHAKYLVFGRQIGQYTPHLISRLAGICKKQAIIATLSLNCRQQFEVNCEQIKPRISEHNKKHVQEISMTEELALLKKKIGYDL